MGNLCASGKQKELIAEDAVLSDERPDEELQNEGDAADEMAEQPETSFLWSIPPAAAALCIVLTFAAAVLFMSWGIFNTVESTGLVSSVGAGLLVDALPLILVVGLLITVCCCAISFVKAPAGSFQTTEFGADQLKEAMFDYWQDHPDRAELPEGLQGLFWMRSGIMAAVQRAPPPHPRVPRTTPRSDNPASELCVTLEGAVVDKDARTVTVWTFPKRFWSRSVTSNGYWLAFFGSAFCLGGRYVLQFDEAWKFANITLYLINGWIPVPSVIATFSIEQIDRNAWLRKTTWLGDPLESGTYTWIRVVDGEGRKLPSYDDMVLATKTLDPAFFRKSFMQVVST